MRLRRYLQWRKFELPQRELTIRTFYLLSVGLHVWLQTKQQPAAAQLHNTRARARTHAPEFVLQNTKNRQTNSVSSDPTGRFDPWKNTDNRLKAIQQLYHRRELQSEPRARPNPPPRPVTFGPGTSICRTVKVPASTRKPAAGLTQHQRPQDGREEGQAEQEPRVLFHHHRKSRTMTAGRTTRSGRESSWICSSRLNRAVGGAYKHVRIGSGPIVEPDSDRGPALTICGKS